MTVKASHAKMEHVLTELTATLVSVNQVFGASAVVGVSQTSIIGFHSKRCNLLKSFKD